jgi:pimeloyl-ACP methyl ester carboxylesterase
VSFYGASNRTTPDVTNHNHEDIHMKSKLTLALAIMLGSAATYATPPIAGIKNVVLVHGAFADGSGWEPIATMLTRKGYNVSIVQEPETSFADDVKAAKRVIDMQSGPVVLVGHSYGGAIITEAGNDPKVSALVYVAALQPDTGEVPGALLQKTPAAGKGIKPAGDDGFLYIDPAQFASDFAADLPKEKTDFMARSQVFVAAAALGTPISNAAWKTKPTWAIVATQDRSINPELERFMYKRSNSKVTEIKSSHAVYISHPSEVSRVIEEAANTPAKN